MFPLVLRLAYLNFLVAASEKDVLALSKDSSVILAPSLVVAVSHLIAYWVQAQPLGGLLGQAVDGGAPVSEELWHPHRGPVFHQPEAVKTLDNQLVAAWQQLLAEQVLPDDDWYRVEIEKLLRLFRHASDRGECVVSFLDRPADHERASRVRIPFQWALGRG